MNLPILENIALILSMISILSSFVPRFPACVLAFSSLLMLHYSGNESIASSTLIYWALATAIVLGLDYLQPRALMATNRGHAYVVGGAIVGTLLGFLISATSGAIILGAAVGAFLGTTAYMRTPKGPHFNIASDEFIQYLCAKGLPAVVTSSMAAISIVTKL